MTPPPATYRIAALYQFVELPDFETVRARLFDRGKALDLVGSLLLAREGINGSIAGKPDAIDTFLDELRTDSRFAALDIKFSTSTEPPFRRWKVRPKSEIVSFGIRDADPKTAVGEYIPPAEWNDLIRQEDVLLIDTRNHYETAIGSFQGAIDPDTETFRDFPAWADKHLPENRDQKIAMYCTGGIRCEKATSYLLQQGYRNIFHLEGGILRYLEETPPAQSLWKGDCFVFDDRVALDPQLQPAPYQLCDACQMPVPEGTLHECKRIKRAKWLKAN